MLEKNGLITKTQKAKENSRGSSVQEEVDVYKTNYKIAIETNTVLRQTKEQKINEMKTKNLITDEEANALKNDETIQIGDFLISMLLEETEPIVISITLDKTSITKEIISGSTGTETLTANLKNASGELSWISSYTSVAEISGEGNTRTITLKKAGTATITVSYGAASTTCEITVTEAIEIGSYVEYNVEYEDMGTGSIYNKDNGWRYLGKDDNENYLIVSTAIPGILYYYNLPSSKPNWWATSAEVQADTGVYQTNGGWNRNYSGAYPNKYAAYGLRYKFESILFNYQESGTSVRLNFRSNGLNVVDVHNLTLVELNRATSSANGSIRSDTSTSSGFKELEGSAKGLFDLYDLGSTSMPKYWISHPASGDQNIYYVDQYENLCYKCWSGQ